MARQSQEAKSLAAFRAGDAPLAPPRYLSKPATALWRQIVTSRPPDWFDQGNSVLLEAFCTLSIQARGLHGQLAKGTEVDAALLRRCLAIVKTLVNLAVRLRLTPQAGIDRRSRMLDERNDPGASDDPLIGGDTGKPN